MNVKCSACWGWLNMLRERYVIFGTMKGESRVEHWHERCYLTRHF